jgi:hypothetical protein
VKAEKHSSRVKAEKRSSHECEYKYERVRKKLLTNEICIKFKIYLKPSFEKTLKASLSRGKLPENS